VFSLRGIQYVWSVLVSRCQETVGGAVSPAWGGAGQRA